MRRIRIPNPLVDRTYRGYLGADYSSGVNLTLASTVSFSNNDLIVVGEPREEATEEKKITSVDSVTALTLPSALNFTHNKGTSVYKVLWDFISIEGRSSSSGTFAEITQSPIQWDNRNNETVYYHQAGTDNWEYRYRFYNSVTASYSEYSPTISGATPARNAVRYMIREIRKLTGDEERKIIPDDNELIRQLNKAEEIIYANNARYWFLLVDTKKQGTGIAATAGNGVYSFGSLTNFGHLDSLRYEYDDGSADELYHLIKKGELEFDNITTDQNRTGDNRPEIYKLLPPDSSSDGGYFQIEPVPTSNGVGTFYPNYYQTMGHLDGVDDETLVPIPSILEDFGIAYVEKIKGNEKKAAIYEESFYGPSDLKKRTQQLTGIALLDKLNKAHKEAAGQPGVVKRFKGPNAGRSLYGYRRYSNDRRINNW